MEKKIKVSVIMPSLNVGKYIERCLQSVVMQTLHDIELLCIDAGSTDGTEDILKKYSRQDNRIKVIHSDVKSYGYQVNLGIRIASGDYIGIVETDDAVLPNMFSVLYSCAEPDHLDYCKCGFYFLEHGAKRYSNALSDTGRTDLYNNIIRPIDHIDAIYTEWQIWNGIYRRDFLVNNNIYLNESGGAAYQDIGFGILTQTYANKAVYLREAYYLYTYDRYEASSWNLKCLKNSANEFRLLLNYNFPPSVDYKAYIKLVYIRMAESLLGESDKLLQKMNYDSSKNEFKEPFDWFRTVLRQDNYWSILKEICTRDVIDTERLIFLLESPRGYSEQLCAANKYRALKLQEMKDVIRRHNNRIVIAGCGVRGQRVAREIINHNNISRNYISIDAFADNSKDKWNTEIEGVHVLSPDEAVERFSDDVFLVANKNNAGQIRGQLLKFGIQYESIVIY